MQEHIHLRHRERDGVQLLAVELGRLGAQVGVSLLVAHPRLDEQASAAAGRVVDGGAGGGVEQFGHQPADLLGRIELARALPLPLGELAQQVLIRAAQDVRLGVAQAEAVARDDLDEGAEAVVIQRALPALALVVVLHIQHALQVGIEPRHLAHRRRHELAQ